MNAKTIDEILESIRGRRPVISFCGEPPPGYELDVQDALPIIEEERIGQLDDLISVMISPVVARGTLLLVGGRGQTIRSGRRPFRT